MFYFDNGVVTMSVWRTGFYVKVVCQLEINVACLFGKIKCVRDSCETLSDGCQVKNDKCIGRTQQVINISFSLQGLVQRMKNLTIHSNRQQISENTKKLFLVFYQTVGVQQKFNIDYI